MSRYTPTGLLDSDFRSLGAAMFSSGCRTGANDVLTRSNGEIVIIGTGCFADVLHLSENGQEINAGATTFPELGQGPLTRGALSPAGAIHVLAASSPSLLARLTLASALDTTFQSNGLESFSDDLGLIAVQADGKILLAGNAGGGTQLRRLTADGNPDVTFALNGARVVQEPSLVLALDAQDRILLAGSSVTRLRSDGTLDTTFGYAGTISLPGYRIKAIAFQPDGKIVLAAEVGSDIPEVAIARLWP